MANNKHREAIALLLSIVSVVLLTACGSGAPKTDSSGYADQEAFLNDMAKGIKNRLEVSDKDISSMSDEEHSKYYLELVGYELKKIEKYADATFEDSKFNDLAHEYISACQMQRMGAENIRNKDLYKALWNGGLTVRSGIIVYLYEHYGLPITSEEAASYSDSSTNYTISIVPSSSNAGKVEEKPRYHLGDINSAMCENGEAKISLNGVSVDGTVISWTATNHGDLGFSNNNFDWKLTYYDSDGYALGRRSNYGETSPLKPNATVSYCDDFKFASYADKVAYVSIDYCAFIGGPTDEANHTRTTVDYYYAFDMNGKQIDYNSLIQ